MIVYVVEIVKIEGDEVIHRIPCGPGERHACKVEDGVNINLNHEEYYTRLVVIGDDKQEKA